MQLFALLEREENAPEAPKATLQRALVRGWLDILLSGKTPRGEEELAALPTLSETWLSMTSPTIT